MSQQDATTIISPSGKVSHRLLLGMTTLALLVLPLTLSAVFESSEKSDAAWLSLIEKRLASEIRAEDIVNMSGRYSLGIEDETWIVCASAYDSDDLRFQEAVQPFKRGAPHNADPFSGPERAELRTAADRFCAKVGEIYAETSG